MHENYNDILKKEIDAMMVASIVKPAISPWDFPVMTSKKKNGSPRLCLNHQALNKRMKSAKFPLSEAEEVIEDMVSSKFFSKLGVFAGY